MPQVKWLTKEQTEGIKCINDHFDEFRNFLIDDIKVYFNCGLFFFLYKTQTVL